MWVSEELRASQEERVHPFSSMLLQAWEAMRGERSAPLRQDLDLKQVRKLLPGLFIAEQDAPSGDFVWRLAGTAVTALMEREVTGRSISEGWDSFESGTIRRFLSGVSGTHRPGLLRMRFLTDRGQWIVAEMAAMLTAWRISPRNRKPEMISAASRATISWASSVEAPRCGVASTLGCLGRRFSAGGGSFSNTSRAAPAT